MKTRMFAVCAVILLFCGVAHADLNDGLVAYYPFNGSAIDESGSGNNGTVNGAALTVDRFGKPDSAYSFDGVNNSISIPDSASLDVITHFSLTAWVFIKGPNSGYPDQAIISKVGGSSGNNGYQLALESPTSSGASVGLAFNSEGESWPANYLKAGNVPLNKWTYLTGIYDYNELKIYINGILAGAKIIGAKNVVNSRSMLRISGDDNMHAYVNGYIDDVRIYNRSISESEIQQLYRGGTCSSEIVKFTAGTPAKAADVNANFDALNCQIQALKAIVCKNEPTASVCQ